MSDAKVTVTADASAVERAMNSALASIKNLSKGAAEAVGYGLTSVTSGLSEVALAQGKVSFSSQHQQVQAFEAATARMAVASGRDLDVVRSSFESVGVATGKRPQEVADWAAAVGKLTYNLGGAGEAFKGMSQLSAATGRSVEDYRGLAAELGTVGKVTGDTTHAIGMMAAQAEKFKVPGGIAAFADHIEALGDTISHFSVTSEQDFLKVTAGMAALEKQSNSPAMAARVGQATFGSIASNPMEWSRYLGKDITDKYGHVEKPTEVLQQITDKIKRTYGKDATRMLMLQFGPEAGKALARADFSAAAEATGLAPSTTTADAQGKYLATDAGKRDIAGAQLSESARDLMGSSTLLGRAADALQKFAASNPIASTATSTIASTAISTLLSGRVAGKLLGAGGELAGGVSVGGASLTGLATKAGAVGAAVGSLYLAYDRITETAKELGGWQSVGKDLKDWFSGSKPAVSKGPELRKPGETDEQFSKRLHEERGARDAARAAQVNVHVKVEHAPETPITATVKTSNSAAAGSQAGG